ncbi:MAG: class I SAM-dependent methyltransferase [Rhodospirillaceae bacterium]
MESSVKNDGVAPKKSRGNYFQSRGAIGRHRRLPELDLESRDDFLTGFRTWTARETFPVANVRVDEILKEKGIDSEEDLSFKEVAELVDGDPIVGMSARTWLSCHKMTWQNFYDECHNNADTYFDELEAADNIGPGKLELNPDLDIPDYCKHEVHIMPGGYVGDPFGGYIFHYGSNNFYRGTNYQDAVHEKYAKQVPVPEDGKVRRILDLGCTIGQHAVALKERFPDAEVWGVDVGGPMVRYAHKRAVDLGIEVNFRQRPAEDTKFPDGYFDIVTSYILHHEAAEEGTRAILKEAYRVLRPGGIYYPNDINTSTPAPKLSAGMKVQLWWHTRWNHEAWALDYIDMDYTGAMRDAGFEIQDGPARIAGMPGGNLLGVKAA